MRAHRPGMDKALRLGRPSHGGSALISAAKCSCGKAFQGNPPANAAPRITADIDDARLVQKRKVAATIGPYMFTSKPARGAPKLKFKLRNPACRSIPGFSS
jgi:hypothetical protein